MSTEENGKLLESELRKAVEFVVEGNKGLPKLFLTAHSICGNAV